MRRAALTIVTTIVGLVLLLQFKTHAAGSGGGLASVGTITPSSHHRTHRRSTPTPAARRTAPAAVHTAKPAQPKTVTSTGQTVQTPYGPVQVKIVETDGQLTDVVPLQLPGGNPRSSEIAAGATPILRSEALRANSARIHVVSGATYTSDGYAQSLQSAIDSA